MTACTPGQQQVSVATVKRRRYQTIEVALVGVFEESRLESKGKVLRPARIAELTRLGEREREGEGGKVVTKLFSFSLFFFVLTR